MIHRMGNLKAALIVLIAAVPSFPAWSQDWRLEVLPDICTAVARGENGIISLRLGETATTISAGFITIPSNFPKAPDGHTSQAGFNFRSGEHVTPYKVNVVYVGNDLWFLDGNIAQFFRLVAAEDTVDFILGGTYLDRLSLRGSSATMARMAQCAASKR